MWDINFETKETKEFLKLPILRSNPQITFNNNLIKFKNINGKTFILGDDIDLISLSISSLFPNQSLRGFPNMILKEQCIDYFERNRLEEFKLVIADNTKTILNIFVKISNFTYSDRPNLDAEYTISLTEFKEKV